MNRHLPVLATMLFLVSCGGSDKNEDLVQEVNKQGAIESSIKVEHLDSARDMIVTTYKVWHKGDNINSIEHRDTIPSLGTGLVEGKDAISGNDKTGIGAKDYEVFITLK